MSYECKSSVSLPEGVVGWSAASECVFSWSYSRSLTLYVTLGNKESSMSYSHSLTVF